MPTAKLLWLARWQCSDMYRSDADPQFTEKPNSARTNDSWLAAIIG